MSKMASSGARVEVPIGAEFLLKPELPLLDGLPLPLPDLLQPTCAEIITHHRMLRRQITATWTAHSAAILSTALPHPLTIAVDAIESRLAAWAAALDVARPAGSHAVRSLAGDALAHFGNPDKLVEPVHAVVAKWMATTLRYRSLRGLEDAYRRHAAAASQRGMGALARELFLRWRWSDRFEAALVKDVRSLGLEPGDLVVS